MEKIIVTSKVFWQELSKKDGFALTTNKSEYQAILKENGKTYKIFIDNDYGK